MARELVSTIENKRKNYLINSAMDFAQRSASFPAAVTGKYNLDRYRFSNSSAGIFTVSQDTDVPTAAEANFNFTYSLRVLATTPDTSIAAGDLCAIEQRIEGSNFAEIAQKLTNLSFWVKSSISGIYCASLSNSGDDRSVVQEYTINSTNTWEYKTITFPESPETGTWDYTNGVGIKVFWTLSAGSTFQTTAGAWQNAGSLFATANQVNGINTGADFKITGVMLNEGSVAAPFERVGKTIEQELSLCQRYYEKSYNIDVDPATITNLGATLFVAANSGNQEQNQELFKVTKRALPTMFIYSPATGTLGQRRDFSAGADVADAGSTISQRIFMSQGSFVDGRIYGIHYAADAEL